MILDLLHFRVPRNMLQMKEKLKICLPAIFHRGSQCTPSLLSKGSYSEIWPLQKTLLKGDKLGMGLRVLRPARTDLSCTDMDKYYQRNRLKEITL